MGETKTEPLVSVITAMYNSEKYIAETIQSVLSQTYQNWEMLIVDDKSTDKSLAIAGEFAKSDARIKIFPLHKNHKLPAEPRNVATDNAGGKYIAFLDSDDTWYPEKLATQIHQMEYNQWEICFSGYMKKYEDNAGKKKCINVPAAVSYYDMLKTNSIGNLTAVYNVEKLGKLKQANRFFEDYIMWLQVLRKGFIAHGIQKPLATYRVHSKSNSYNKFRNLKEQWSIYREIVGLNLVRSCWYFFHYSFNGLKKL